MQGLLFDVTNDSAIKISQQIQSNKLKRKIRLNTTQKYIIVNMIHNY